jgi:hypothetical protein
MEGDVVGGDDKSDPGRLVGAAVSIEMVCGWGGAAEGCVRSSATS